MNLLVHITCPKCHSFRVVMCHEWDIDKVEHHCEPDPVGPGDPNLRRRTPQGREAWRITFNPERGIY